MTPRIPPIPPGEWPPEMKDAIAALAPAEPRIPIPPRRDDRPKALNALGTFANYPVLTRAWHTFNGHILFGSSLTPRQRELLVLRVAAVRDAEYEWVQHTVLAGDAGITAEEIARVREGPQAEGWPAIDAAMLQAVDELIADAEVGDATWKALSAELDTEQLMDLVFTVGAYDLLAMAFQSFGLELDADLEAWK